jgi:hypothetical protein
MVDGAPLPLPPPGTPLAGGGVAGTVLATWMWPPRIAWQGWVPTGEAWAPTDAWGSAGWAGTQVQAFYPTELPDDAGPPPEGGGTYTVIRVVPPGGWSSELW